MSDRAIVRRLRAWKVREPVTRGQTIHTATADASNRLLLAFVKMGGETRPWAVMWKSGTEPPQFRSVPEPRFRASIDEVMAELAGVVAAHLRHPATTSSPPAAAGALAPLRQIWVPNPSHVEMFHHLAYAYARRRKDADHADELRLLGRASLFLFLTAQVPGQQLVMVASDVLRSAYDFPAQDVRQAHLGFLLGWLSARRDPDHGWAAATEAERHPVSTAMLPDVERRDLAPVVERFNEARRAEDEAAMADAERQVSAILRPELERRVDLVEQAIEIVEKDPRPVNAGVVDLRRHTLDVHWWDYVQPEAAALQRGEDPYVPSPESDDAAPAAAARFFRNQAAADRYAAALVHGDRELEAEAIAAGQAFRGTIVAVNDEGSSRRMEPVLTIEDPTPGPLRLRVGDLVCVVGHAKRNGRIRSIDTTRGGGLRLVLVIHGHKKPVTGMPWPHSMGAADPRWTGLTITVTGDSFAEMTEKKARRVRDRSPQPGDWLLADSDVPDPDEEGAA